MRAAVTIRKAKGQRHVDGAWTVVLTSNDAGRRRKEDNNKHQFVGMRNHYAQVTDMLLDRFRNEEKRRERERERESMQGTPCMTPLS